MASQVSQMKSLTLLFLFSILSVFYSSQVYSETCRIAVAANFSGTIKKLKQQFETESPHKIQISTGSTGQLLAQIQNGAPYDIFLAADTKSPSDLVRLGYAAQSSEYPSTVNYAQGQLALWSFNPNIVLNEKYLRDYSKKKIAIANPKTAPYGKAAMEVLNNLNLLLNNKESKQFIYGESIAQTMLFIQSGNIDLGFVALSQIQALPQHQQGSWWLPPQALYMPIIQQAIILKRAQKNSAAFAFMSYLQSQTAQRIITQMGYSLPQPFNHTKAIQQ